MLLIVAEKHLFATNFAIQFNVIKFPLQLPQLLVVVVLLLANLGSLQNQSSLTPYKCTISSCIKFVTHNANTTHKAVRLPLPSQAISSLPHRRLPLSDASSQQHRVIFLIIALHARSPLLQKTPSIVIFAWRSFIISTSQIFTKDISQTGNFSLPPSLLFYFYSLSFLLSMFFRHIIVFLVRIWGYPSVWQELNRALICLPKSVRSVLFFSL